MRSRPPSSARGSRRARSQWTPPKPIAHDPFRSVGNGVVWEAPDGLVWLFYVVRFGETWSTSRIQFKVSRDGAETWSDASVLSLDEGDMVRSRPIVLKNGDYLLPIYHETGNDPEKAGADSTSLFLRFDPAKKTWTKTGADPLAKREHPAGGGAARRRPPDRLLPPRRRLRPQDDRLHRPVRVARRRPDLERGQGLRVPEPQRRGRLPQAPQRPAAPDLQRQHDTAGRR